MAFRILDNFYRELGHVLYALGDSISNIRDSQVREALEKADSKYPYQHTVRMPFGSPLR